ncbi:MAG: pyruvate kinase [Rhodospirillales bacterium]|nr:pyruvate kinase [Rhodospirillales bacterium]
MRRHRRAKIVATLGPASASPEMIRTLFDEGADMFRLNFSHGSHADHAERVKIIRQIERDVGRPIGILLDLQGPKLRVGVMENGAVDLVAGETYRLDLSKEPGNQTRAPLPHPEIFAALRDGTDLLLDDGKIRLTVTARGADFAETKIITGGKLSDRKGVNVPQVVLAVSPITEKDRKDLDYGLSLGVDWIGLSFVQLPDDVAEARKIIGRRAAIMSKLEKPAAIDRLDEIVALSDGIMVARGDLGVELPPEDVPSLQKQIIRASRAAGKPVVVATQMLESMISAPAPTRAEASDVATAVYDGADAVMLSAESAAGAYPREAVAMMNRIIERTEKDPNYRAIMEAVELDPESTSSDAITAAAAQVARTVRAAAIVTFTTSGSTSLRAARERPTVPILCLTESRETARRLAVAWGVHCVVTQDVQDFGDMVVKACALALREEFAANGQRIVITAGVPFGTPGATNVLRIAWVGT